MALHENQAKRSFEEVIAFDDAVKAVLQAVNPSETLIVVTADHSHNMNIIGFPSKSTSILGNQSCRNYNCNLTLVWF